MQPAGRGTREGKGGATVARLRAAPRPTLRQALLLLGLLGIVALMGARVAGLVTELREARAARAELEGKRDVLEARHGDLEEQARLVEDPDSLETELRSRYNYKAPGERVIIVVPPRATSGEPAR